MTRSARFIKVQHEISKKTIVDPGLRALLRLDVAGRHPQQPPAPPAALGDPPVEIASALGETWNDTFGTLQKWAPIYGYLQYVYI